MWLHVMVVTHQAIQNAYRGRRASLPTTRVVRNDQDRRNVAYVIRNHGLDKSSKSDCRSQPTQDRTMGFENSGDKGCKPSPGDTGRPAGQLSRP